MKIIEEIQKKKVKSTLTLLFSVAKLFFLTLFLKFILNILNKYSGIKLKFIAKYALRKNLINLYYICLLLFLVK